MTVDKGFNLTQCSDDFYFSMEVEPVREARSVVNKVPLDESNMNCLVKYTGKYVSHVYLNSTKHHDSICELLYQSSVEVKNKSIRAYLRILSTNEALKLYYETQQGSSRGPISGIFAK